MLNTNMRSITRIMNNLESQALRRNWGINQLKKHLLKYHVLGESYQDGTAGEYWFRVFGEDGEEVYTGEVNYDPETEKIYEVKTRRIYDFGKKEFKKLQRTLKKYIDSDKADFSNDKGNVYYTTSERSDFGEKISFEIISHKYLNTLTFIHFYENGALSDNYAVFNERNKIVDLDSDVKEELEWIFKNFIK